MSDNKSSGQFPFSGGIAIILLALGIFIIPDNPFSPTRPDGASNASSNTEDVRARLWQDPFEAVEFHRNEQHSDNPKENNHLSAKIHSHIKCYIGDKDKISTIKSDITLSPDSKNKTNISPLLVSSTHDFDELLCQLQRDTKVTSQKKTNDYDLHIIAVMVTGSAYAEDKEHRIRSRYAVTTGLMSTGYIPVDSEHIGYMDLSKLCRNNMLENNAAEHSDICDWPDIIPHEQFKLSNTAKKWSEYRFAENILVLWINDEIISKNKPLTMLSKLKITLTPGEISRNIALVNDNNEIINPNNIKIKFDVIGPASSTTLIKMHQNLNCKTNINDCNNIVNKFGDNNNKIRIFSPRATLDDAAIKTSLSTSYEYNNKKLNNNLIFPGFHRTIATDSMLVDNLLCEILRRGINPFHDKNHITKNNNKALHIGNTQCINYSLKSLNKLNKKDYLVLIGEWDTSYSRNFKELFKEKIKSVSCSSLKDSSECEIEFNWLYSFFYLRGLDGEVSKNSSSEKKKTTSDPDNTRKSLRRAVGANQFDYLRRLGDQVTALAKSNFDKGTIRAIGIVGSDTYDKLLILQALRNRFPDVLFFTTDLDARMLHQDENKHTRNLIVASSFGLYPTNTQYTYQGLAFRDSYQTALYNTIQKTINNSSANQYKKCTKFHYPTNRGHNNNKEENVECVSPIKLFEIGNKTAVDYSHENNTYSTNPGDTNKPVNIKSKNTLYSFIFISLFILMFLLTSNSTRLYTALIFFIISYVAIWLNTYDLTSNKEFQAFFSGTSVWPAYIIRMVASITSIVLIIYAIINLKTNTIDIITENELSQKPCLRFTDTLRNSTIDSGINLIRRYTSLFTSSLKWLLCYDYYDAKASRINPGYFTCTFISSWGFKDKRHEKKYLNDLFYQYLYLSKPLPRFLRVAFISIFYLIITIAIMHSFPNFPVTPYVGMVNADTGFYMILSVLIPYVFLIFLVSDITRLNSRFVLLLIKYDIAWPEKVLDRYCAKFGLTKEIAIEKLKIDLVVKRSKVVDKLICFPFIILTLMILSRSDYFDRWHMPPQLAFIILLGALIALSSAIRLRQSAKKARYAALEKLNEIYTSLIYKEANPLMYAKSESSSCNLKMSESVRNMIDDIESIKTGPFTPLAQHPIISAIALPFGGVGGLYIIDALTKMNI